MNENLNKLISKLSDGAFHSGAQSGRDLGITRSAVWKLMNQFSNLEIEVESVTGKGYCIPGGLDLLNLKKIKRYIQKLSLEKIRKIEIFDQIGSTNDYLIELSSSNPDKICICLAEQQMKGKGRLGRRWFSPFGANIYLSVLYPFSKDMSELAGLSLVVATVVAETLSEIGIEKNIGLKWPNDVLWKNRKLAGILIEISGEAHGVNHVVIGIGLNIRMSKSIAKTIDQPWVDIQEIKADVADRNKITGLLINKLIEKIEVFKKQGFLPFCKHFRKLDILVGQPVKIITVLGQINGVAQGIDEQGRFILKDQSGKRHIFSAGDISIRKKEIRNKEKIKLCH